MVFNSSRHDQLNLNKVCDKERCYCQAEIKVYDQQLGMKSSSTTRKRSVVKMTFWSRCLLALFLHIGCLAVDHRHRISELSYEKDDLRLILGQSFATTKLVGDESELSERVVTDGSSILSFQPLFLDFKESTVGIPSLGVVRVDNKLTDETVKLISISGSTVHFHSSFFADKVISPGSNTTFEIVFLSRSEGLVDSNLYIHTSKGLFKYYVQGIGQSNPYRLKPLVGARIPVNGSYESLITMHNPHGKRIQVVEILSSGSDFRLSLPEPLESEEEGAWAIEPFQTKPVMKGTFQGKAEGNHTGYIKIRVNSTQTASEYLLLPVEVQVSASPGIYSPQESLDFGLLVKTDKPRTLSVSLINSQPLPVNVQSVSVKGSPNNAVRIEFRPISIEQDSNTSTVVALVTFDPSDVTSPIDSHGFLEICSDHGDAITIPFRATVLNGELEYNSSSLGFYVKANRYPARNFSIRNTFPTAVAIYDVKLSHPEILKLTNFNSNGSQIVESGETMELFRIKVKDPVELCDSKNDIYFTLKSNVTTIKLPITCYDGKLESHALEGSQIKFGRVELYSNHLEYFSVGNCNPVEIRLKSWGSNITWAAVELVGMRQGRKEDLAKIQNFDLLKKSLFLQPGQMAVFSIEVRRPTVEGVFIGEAFVTTDHNQTIRVRFTVAVSKGSIHTDPILFDKSFPGKISVEKLHLSSTFNQTLTLRNIFIRPEGAPLWFTSMSMQQLDILPHRKTLLGKVYYDPKQHCGDNCYSGFLLDSPIGKEWVGASVINWETTRVDSTILKKLQKLFQNVKDINLTNMTLWVETSAAKGFKIPARVNYAWPRITSSKPVVFPLTAIGNQTFVDIPVYNPTNTPLFVHALMESEYFNPVSWGQHRQQENEYGTNTTDGGFAFSLTGLASDSSQSSEKSAIFTEVQRSIVGDFMDTKPKVGVSFVIPPSAKFYLRCRFKPVSKQVASTSIIVRNNLTGVETISVKGRAGTGLLTLGSGTPGSSLLFQITEKLLQGCEQEQTSKYLPPQLTVRRSFVARNIGDIPLNIDVVEIYPPQSYSWIGFWSTAQGESCEGFGFRILNCSPFTLLPNETHSIDIAYTPDFTMSRMVRSLRLLDSNGVYYNYTLVAMVPSAMLDVCSKMITRPVWESTLKYVLVAVVVGGLFAASFLAFCDSAGIVSQAVVATVRVRHSQDPTPVVIKEEAKVTLDLKAVYEGVDNRFKRSQQELLANQAGGTSPGGTTKSRPNQTTTTTQPSPPTTPNPVVTAPTPPTATTVSSQTSTPIPTSARPESTYQPAGLRNRKKNNTRTAAYLASELLNAETNISTARWIKIEDREEDRQASNAQEDSTNNNLNLSKDVKKYTEVTGKRKGKWSSGKGKNRHYKPSTPVAEELTSRVERPSHELGNVCVESPPKVEPCNENDDDSEGRKQKGKFGSKRQRNQDGILKPFGNEQASKGPNNTFSSSKPKTERKNSGTKTGNELVRHASSPSPSSLVKPTLAFNPEANKNGIRKQKQLSGSSSSGSHGSGSPIDFPSRSGTPRSSLDGGHDNLLQRRASAGSSFDCNDAYFFSPPPGYTQIPNPLAYPPFYYAQPQFGNHKSNGDGMNYQQRSSYESTNNNKSVRRPGVIGQPRQSSTTAPLSSQGNHGFETFAGLSSNTTATYQRQSHGTATRTPSWSPDLRGVNSTIGQEGWSSSRSTSEIYPSCNNIPFSRPAPTSTPSSNTNNELYNFSSALPTDLISSLWQMNSFDRIPTSQYNRLGGTETSRGFGQSSLSDSGYQDNHWPSKYYQSSQLDQNTPNISPHGFLPTTDTTTQTTTRTGWSSMRTSPFDRNGDVTARDGRPLTDIWQNNVQQPYWPSTLSDSTTRPAASNLTGSAGNKYGLQSQREIEAGLGFNPFGSNIWTPSDSDVQSKEWSGGGNGGANH